VDARELAAVFGLGPAVSLTDGPVARGKEGVVWRLETADGDWAVKVPFATSTEDDVRSSTRFQEAAHTAGVPTPQVRRTTEGRVFATVQGEQARVHGWVDLEPPDPLLDPEAVGSLLAALHRLPTPAPGPAPLDPWYVEPVGADRWDRLVEELRQAGAPFAGRLAGLRDELVALESWIEPPETLRICHRDLWADNLLATRDGGLCVIDWENSGPADPSHELGCAVFEFARSDPRRARTLVDAYRAGGGPGVLDRPGRFSMLIAQLGHLAEVASTDWLVPTSRSPDRVASTAWVSEVLDQPHTRELLKTLLTAVAGSG
jgi:aminoglycoside phosphotransferase (APT) family kinase protein